MHDLDRALQELESDEGTFGSYEFAQDTEMENGYEAEGDYEGESDFEAGGDHEGESYEGESYEGESYEGEGASEGEGEYHDEASFEGESDSEAIFDEIEEMEQAAALLEVQDEQELDHFLGGLIAKAKKALGAYLPPGAQKALADGLKNVARVALPKVGAALGNMVVPGVGGVLGAGVASNAGKMFGLELEGMSQEDQEFEVARRVVGLGVQATKAAAESVSPAPPPQAAMGRATATRTMLRATGRVRDMRAPDSGGGKGADGAARLARKSDVNAGFRPS